MISPAAGTYTSAQSVTTTDATAGATIYSTINGTTPMAGAAAIGLVGIAGCGGSSNSTPAGNYSIPVDVTSGATLVPLNLSITVD